MKDQLTRRRFLCSSAAIGVALPLFSIVAACDSKPAAGGGATAGGGGGGAAPAADGPICDVAKLSDADLAPRNALGYIDKSTTADKTCANCQLFLPDNPGCAGCTLFKGPVAAEGYCNSWAAKA